MDSGLPLPLCLYSCTVQLKVRSNDLRGLAFSSEMKNSFTFISLPGGKVKMIFLLFIGLDFSRPCRRLINQYSSHLKLRLLICCISEAVMEVPGMPKLRKFRVS